MFFYKGIREKIGKHLFRKVLSEARYNDENSLKSIVKNFKALKWVFLCFDRVFLELYATYIANCVLNVKNELLLKSLF